MAKIVWDESGKRLYETGVKMVYYIYKMKLEHIIKV